MKMTVKQVSPSNMAGMVTVKGTVDGKKFVAEIYPGTRKLESVKVEETYVYVENVADAADVKFAAASAEFVYNFQAAIKAKVETISVK